MNVDAIHYHHHGSIPASERLSNNNNNNNSSGRDDRIETALPVTNNRLTTTTSNSPTNLKKKKKSLKLQQSRQPTKIVHKLTEETKDIVDFSYSSSHDSADDQLEEEEIEQKQQQQHPRSPQPRSPQHISESVPITVVEQPASGTDPEVLKRPLRSKVGQQPHAETDFFLQPTILSRLILNQKYGRAIQRVFDHSEETSTWLCAKHATATPTSQTSSTPDPTIIHSIRQLPIHLACSNLGRAQDRTTLSLLNELISVLVFAHPDGAHTPDHRNVYPIQEAIWYGATPETVAIFFMALPESLLIIDHHGRSLTDINQYRNGTGKDAIQKMIDRDVRFWKVARDEAALRLQHNANLYPSGNQSINSQSVLASPDAEEDTIFTIQESTTKKSYYEDHITPLSWDQLEQRTKATEQILHAVNEENFRLKQQVENLTNKKSHTHVSLMKELKRLDRENATLSEKLYQMEQLLKDRCVTDDEERNEQFRLAMAEVSSLVGLSEPSSIFSGFRASDQFETESTSQRLYQEAVLVQKKLAKKHLEQREKIRKLRHMVSYTIINDATINNESDIEKDSSSSFADVSTISALSLETARSDVSRTIHKKRFHYNEGVVDRLPYETHVLDDLSHIIQYAATRQEIAAKKRGTPARVQDDLSGILRWAAKKDRRDIFYGNSEIDSVESTWSPIHPNVIWNSIPPKSGTNVTISKKSKNKVPAPTTRPIKVNTSRRRHSTTTMPSSAGAVHHTSMKTNLPVHHKRATTTKTTSDSHNRDTNDTNDTQHHELEASLFGRAEV